MTEFRPPQERFGTGTLAPLLERAAGSGHGLTFVGGTAGGERRLDFAELATGAAAAAAVLRERGVRPGDRVCLLGSTSAELITAIWGVWYAGAVVVVLPPMRGVAMAEELARWVHAVDARVLGVADALAAAMPGMTGPLAGAEVVSLSGLLAEPGRRVFEDRSESDLAVLQFTSGTTARSRVVALTHRQVLSNLSSFADALELTSEDRGVSWLPHSHAMGLLTTLQAIAIPFDLLLAPTEDFIRHPGFWLDGVSRFAATFTVAPNQAYGIAAQELRMRPRELDLSRLRIAGTGAEMIDARILTGFAHLAGRYGFTGAAFRPAYGLSEATLMVTVSPPHEPWQDVWVDRERLEQDRAAVPTEAGRPGSRQLVTCGRPVPGVEIEIRDAGEAGGAGLPDGRVGEVWVGGPSIMAGYWRDDETTAAVLRDGWLRTGDLGFMHDGHLVVCGRVKDMVVAGGRNLYPEDYEQLTAAHPGIHGGTVAFGLVDVERMVVVAETAFEDDKANSLAVDVMRTLTQELSHAPKEVIMVGPGMLPRTSSGKVQRGVCRERYLAGELPVVASVARR